MKKVKGNKVETSRYELNHRSAIYSNNMVITRYGDVW